MVLEKLYIEKQGKSIAQMTAFSLVEMLMALLVASLLMVALAPVITKKFSENLSISSIGGTRADYKRTWYYDPAKEYHEWSVPNGVNVIKVTAIGGGGAGGGSSFGSREFTTTTNWKVPEGVTKLRVFMTGGGGAGASGGAGKGTVESSLKTTGNSGAITASKDWNISATTAYKNVPAVDSKCVSTQLSKNPSATPVWTFVSDPTKTVMPNSSVVTVKACGGGGGGGGGGCGSWYGGGGGSGGYVNQQVVIPSSVTSISITIGGGGGAGGGDNLKGGNGIAFGGGGGGSEYSSNTSGSSPGGNGGDGRLQSTPGNATGTYSLNGLTAGKGGTTACSGTAYKAGGNGSLEGGGGGASGGGDGGGGGGGGATFFGRYAYSTTTDKDFFLVAPGGGGAAAGKNCGAGGGGGGAGGGAGGQGDYATCLPGAGGTNGNSGKACSGTDGTMVGGGGASPIGDANYCAGGIGGGAQANGAAGKNGYMYISWDKVPIKCDYTQPANAGGGGGAGQVWFGEVTVTPNSTITMTVGKGGAPSELSGNKGEDGGQTSIGSIVSVEGGKSGTYKAEDENIQYSAGTGGKYADVLKNWTTISSADFEALKPLMGQSGSPGTIVADGASGGIGGSTVDRFGATVYGGDAGNAESKGGDAKGYGAGGGGGGGVVTDGNDPGLGGKGGSGYIYIEWGGTNGGGGASGQVITQESVWVTPGTIVKIYPGAGGTAADLKKLTSTVSGTTVTEGYKGQDGQDGGDTYLMVKDASAEKKVGVAKGGKGGLAGAATHGRGGGIKVDGSGNYDPANIQPEIENSTPGATATATEGGMGGTLTEEMCPLLTELKKVGLGGCGGNTSTSGACASAPSATGEGVNAGGLGNGGGGGAVVEVSGVKTPYKGGNGSSGMVTIEWSN